MKIENSHKKVIFLTLAAVWLALYIPNAVWESWFKHDISLLSDFSYIYRNDTGREELCSYIMPLSFVELQGKLMTIPIAIIRDKRTQIFLFENMDLPDDFTPENYAAVLEEDLDERWHFMYHFDEFDFKGVKKDARLQALCRFLLNKSFLEHEEWEKFGMLYDESIMQSLENDGMSIGKGVYGEIAEFLGYDNIDIDLWTDEINDYVNLWVKRSYVYFIFHLYNVILVAICVLKVIAWGVNIGRKKYNNSRKNPVRQTKN